jgi:hypothetical protein
MEMNGPASRTSRFIPGERARPGGDPRVSPRAREKRISCSRWESKRNSSLSLTSRSLSYKN